MTEAPATEILDVDEVAQLLRSSTAHVRNLLNGNIPGLPRIPHVRAGRKLLVRRSVLMKWMEEQESNAATER
jgi:excisionase family DNA binding protein